MCVCADNIWSAMCYVNGKIHFSDQRLSTPRFSQSRMLTRSNASRVLLQRQTVNSVDKVKTNCGQRSHRRRSRTRRLKGCGLLQYIIYGGINQKVHDTITFKQSDFSEIYES